VADASDYSDSSPDVATLSVTWSEPVTDTSTSYETFPDVPHIINKTRRSDWLTSSAESEYIDNNQRNHRPFYRYELDMSVLSPSDHDKITDLHITHSGYDGSSGNTSFLFKDPDDFQVTDVQFGTGDGSTKKFQLKDKYTFGSQTTKFPRGHIDEGTETIKNAGSEVADSDIGINYDTGVVEFSTAPADGNALTATFEFFRLCQFASDTVSVEHATAARRSQTIEIVEVNDGS
jgi:uncharacterized protein (TIGR02217 family)